MKYEVLSVIRRSNDFADVVVRWKGEKVEVKIQVILSSENVIRELEDEMVNRVEQNNNYKKLLELVKK